MSQSALQFTRCRDAQLHTRTTLEDLLRMRVEVTPRLNPASASSFEPCHYCMDNFHAQRYYLIHDDKTQQELLDLFVSPAEWIVAYNYYPSVEPSPNGKVLAHNRVWDDVRVCNSHLADAVQNVRDMIRDAVADFEKE